MLLSPDMTKPPPDLLRAGARQTGGSQWTPWAAWTLAMITETATRAANDTAMTATDHCIMRTGRLR